MNTLRRLVKGEILESAEYQELFQTCFEGKEVKTYAVAVLTALSAKRPTQADVLNFVAYIDKSAPKKKLSSAKRLVNIVGTGGGIPTFNISTTTVFLAAAAGASVVKSGSNSYNSKSGSLDVLNALGIDLNLSVEQLDSMVGELGLGFISPRMYPPILRRIATSILPVNMKDIGGFINFIGPLLCPIQVDAEICGVKSRDYLMMFATALRSIGISKGFCVHAAVGMDEFSAVGVSSYLDIADPSSSYNFQPDDHGMRHSSCGDLAGGNPEDNAMFTQTLLAGRANQAATDTVIANAAFACLATGAAKDIGEAIAKCRDALYSGAALTKLKHSVEFSRDLRAIAV